MNQQERRKAELMVRKRIKAQLMKEQLDAVGFIFCENCGNRPDWRGISLAHRIPLSRGGKTEKSNVRLLCFKCHATKNHAIHEVEGGENDRIHSARLV